MHFHLPKPLHGWREFAGEVGIIVVGVLIALSAEQVIETIHWRHTIDAERRALDEDVSNMWTAMSARVIIQPCIDRRLDDLGLVLQRHEHGAPLEIIAPIGRPSVWSATTNSFQIASADQSLSHMSLADKNVYFGVYQSYEDFKPVATEERASWRTLELLDDPATLDATDWRDLRHAYRDAVDTNRVFKTNLVFGRPDQWLTAFEKFPRFNENTTALDVPMVQDLCRPAVKR
jgi:hypothetical protein